MSKGAREIDTLRDKTHWAQQMLLFDQTTVYPGDTIMMQSTVDNTQGPFTVYTFVASVVRDGAGAATPLGSVVLDEHF